MIIFCIGTHASRVQVLVGLLVVRILLLNIAILLATLSWLFGGVPKHVDIEVTCFGKNIYNLMPNLYNP